jgi:hypothetical protein
LLVVLLLVPVFAFGDCAKDLRGEVFCGAGQCAQAQGGGVWCSRFEDGGAQRTRQGEVVCGIGECARTSAGDIFCSTVEGGSVLKDSRGRVRCEGRCEPAAAKHCESSLADSAR